MSGRQINLNWRSPGPVSSAFMQCNLPVQIINGPIGGGKTTTCFVKVLKLAARQKPSTVDGYRKFKVCVVRDTYRQLWKTTLPSWWKRIPKDVGDWNGAENAPASHRVQFQLQDGTIVDLHADFIAIGENAVEDVLRGYEPTAFLLNEADLLAREVYNFARGRVGRFPDMSEGGPTWYGILMDCNAPELQSWLYQDMFKAKPADVGLFRQPSGLSPHAENTENLPPGYYQNQVSGQPEWYVARMVENKPGYSRAGKPIYPEFVDTLHVARRPLEPIPGIQLRIGLDAGLNPAAAFGQRMPSGQWRIIDELVGEKGTGPKRFGRLLAQRLSERYGSIRAIVAHADPSAAYGADKKGGEFDWIEIVSAECGLRIFAAPTNALIPRLEAVRRPLTTLIDGDPGFLICPEKCPMLREGFNSGYHYRKLPNVDIERYADEPDKTPHSHPHDALQYLMSAGGEDLEIRERHEQGFRRVRHAHHVHDWDPFNPP